MEKIQFAKECYFIICLMHYLTIYMKYESTKDIGDALNKKYGGDDARSKRNAINREISFKIEEDKSIIDQIQEYENLCSTITSEGLKICDVILAIALIEKLPPSWKEY